MLVAPRGRTSSKENVWGFLQRKSLSLKETTDLSLLASPDPLRLFFWAGRFWSVSWLVLFGPSCFLFFLLLFFFLSWSLKCYGFITLQLSSLLLRTHRPLGKIWFRMEMWTNRSVLCEPNPAWNFCSNMHEHLPPEHMSFLECLTVFLSLLQWD